MQKILKVEVKKTKNSHKKIAYFIHGEHPDSAIIRNQGLYLYRSLMEENENISIDFIILANPLIYLKKRDHYRSLVSEFSNKRLRVKVVPFLWIPEKLEAYNLWLTLICNFVNITTYLFFGYSKYEYVCCRSYTSAFYVSKAIKLKRASIKNFIFDPRSVYPLERWSFKFFKSESLYKLWLSREQTLLERSTTLLSIGLGMTDYYKAFNSCPRVVEVPLVYRPVEVLDTHEPYEKLGEKKSITILYAGSLNVGSHNNDANHYVKRCKELLEGNLNIKFVFVIPNISDEILALFYADIKLKDRVIFLQGRQHLGKWLKDSDFGMYFLKDALDSKTRYGIKSVEYLVSGLPMIYDDGAGGVGKIISKMKFGFHIDDSRGIESMLIKNYDKKVISQWAQNKHSLNNVKGCLLDAFEI